MNLTKTEKLYTVPATRVTRLKYEIVNMNLPFIFNVRRVSMTFQFCLQRKRNKSSDPYEICGVDRFWKELIIFPDKLVLYPASSEKKTWKTENGGRKKSDTFNLS